MAIDVLDRPKVAEQETYAGGRIMHDADSHIFEGPGFYDEYLEPKIKDRLLADLEAQWKSDGMFSAENYIAAQQKHDDEEFRQGNFEKINERKFWDAHGAFRKQDRPRAMDLLGFKSQIVYDSFMRGLLREYEQGDDMDLLYGAADTYIRAITDFCAGDDRLIPAGYVPIADPQRAIETTKKVIDAGCWAITMGPDYPRNYSPSHVDLEPVWAMAAEAGLPIIYHLIGGTGRTSQAFKNNGRRKDRAFEGGDGSLTSFDYLCAPLPIIEQVNAFIIDGVFERNPNLQIGLVEFGATWLPGWMRFIDSAQIAYTRIEERMKLLSMRPSEYIQRQVKVAPYHFEETGWLIREAGPNVALFSSDYPHREGGRFPIAKFDASLDQYDIDQEARDRFYFKNYEEMLAGWTRSRAG